MMKIAAVFVLGFGVVLALQEVLLFGFLTDWHWAAYCISDDNCVSTPDLLGDGSLRLTLLVALVVASVVTLLVRDRMRAHRGIQTAP